MPKDIHAQAGAHTGPHSTLNSSSFATANKNRTFAKAMAPASCSEESPGRFFCAYGGRKESFNFDGSAPFLTMCA